MKVTLVAPWAGATDEELVRPKPIFPPLSIMTVAALTPPDIDVEILDEQLRPIDYGTDSDLVGITATTASANRAYKIADRFRLAGKTVVMGGIHVTAMPSEAAEHADALVLGEAEGKWQSLLRDFQAGDLRRIYATEIRPNPEEIPSANREFINKKDYILADTVQTSRGCPFACSFCSVSAFFGRTFRVRPIESVVREVQSLTGKVILFVDDNIMGLPEYARQLFTAIRPLGKQWIGQASISMLKHPELIASAAKSGCVGLFVGMETLSDVSLRKMHKVTNRRSDYEDIINRLHDFGIGILGSFVFGFDEDNEEVFGETVEFVNRAKLDAAQFSILTPFPGTDLFDDLSQQGRITDTNWDHYDGSHVVYKPAHLSVQTLMDGFKSAYQQAYSYKSILARLGPSFMSKPISWAVNLAYRRRALNWVERLSQGPA